jgi:hypothetical protein
MNAPLWVVELAEDFWRAAGEIEPFPRCLLKPIRRTSFMLTVVELPHLSIAGVERHLDRRGWFCTCGEEDRYLRGCLTARDGGGYLFVDSRDDPAERTFSLAHELAHFLRHYWQPRQRAIRVLGPGILDVHDGRRPARLDERTYAVLRDVPLGHHLHLMRREANILSAEIDAVERDADRLALELLAPEAEVLARYGAGTDAKRLLCGTFGLPAAVAEEHAALLCGAVETAPWLERLKVALLLRRAADAGREEEPGGPGDERRA